MKCSYKYIYLIFKKHRTHLNTYTVLNSYNAPVICIPGQPRAADSGDTAGLKCQDLTSDESRQCRGCAAVLISRQYTVKSIQISYYLHFNKLITLMVLFYLQMNPYIYKMYMQKFKHISHISISSEQLTIVVTHYCHPPGSRGF